MPLWFAWKIVLLQYCKQRTNGRNVNSRVVICLKNRTFAVLQTTGLDQHQSTCRLWFAWKIVLLQYCKQQRCCVCTFWLCCDLLEKSYFCSIANNWATQHFCNCIVVICLKNRTFAVLQTTDKLRLRSKYGCDLLEKSYFCCIANNKHGENKNCNLVVICLKNRTFAVLQTTTLEPFKQVFGCDLLEKSYFCCIANNFLAVGSVSSWVVICLKNRTFAVLQTTAIWVTLTFGGCDLLEKSYFCCIANNSATIPIGVYLVVICLKNRTFAVLQTTGKAQALVRRRLWFAWKIVLLLYCKQPNKTWVTS